MPVPSPTTPPLPIAHGPAAVRRFERRPVPPWRATALVWLLVGAGAVLLHGVPRWQAATQVAGLAWAVRLATHPSRTARLQAAALVGAVVLIDVLGAVAPGLWPPGF